MPAHPVCCPLSASRERAWVRARVARDMRLARVPDRAGIAGGALVVPGCVGHAPQVIAGPPAEQEFGLGVVEPGGVVGRADADGRQATRSSEVGAELAVVDR